MPAEPEDPEAHVIREPGAYRVKRVGRITTLERLDVELVASANARLIAQAPEMYGLLKELEWSQFAEGGGDTRCPVCKGDAYPVYEHEPDCRLAAVLKAVEGA